MNEFAQGLFLIVSSSIIMGSLIILFAILILPWMFKIIEKYVEWVYNFGR